MPLNVEVLTALDQEPMSLLELRRAVGSPPQTTIRKHLKALAELGILGRRQEAVFPTVVNYELMAPGRELISVAKVLERWLAHRPEGPVALGTPAAKSATRAMIEGWSASLMRVLASRPLSLTELNKLISGINYPSLERRLAAMRLAGQVEICVGSGRLRPYTVTPWLRRAVAPLAAAIRWERRHASASSAPLGRIDVESGFLLTVPLMELPSDLSGRCRLTVEAPRFELAGVLLDVEQGRVVSCRSRLEGDADAWVCGSTGSWLGWALEETVEGFEIGGDYGLADSVLSSLHRTLAVPVRI